MKTLKELYPAVSFGTSGVRALVSDLTAPVVSAYVMAFVQHLQTSRQLPSRQTVVVGIDLRPSSPVIAAEVCHTLETLGFRTEFAGVCPTPALALRCIQTKAPGIMVTGSHIPYERNGIKFYLPEGEILKQDEEAISNTVIDATLQPGLDSAAQLPQADATTLDGYTSRYVDFFGSEALKGLRIGLYEHSAVGRDLTRGILQQVGADVVPLGRSDDFVPIDTEAVGDNDQAQAQQWCKDYHLDALVSTDGDGDRPLVFDENGEFVRGDMLGLLCANTLGIQNIVVPVSCNTALEKCGKFQRVVRTRIGSPFVIAGMNSLPLQERESVAGFEANGGFLLGSSLPDLVALPTRDALLPILSVLVRAASEQRNISSLIEELPKRYAYSDRIRNFPTQRSNELLNRLTTDPFLQVEISGKSDTPECIDTTDGIRMIFKDGDIVHLRASGNAPELRCYTETANLETAKALCINTLASIQ